MLPLYISSNLWLDAIQVFVSFAKMAGYRLPSLESVRASIAEEREKQKIAQEAELDEVRYQHVVEIPRKAHYTGFLDTFEVIANHKLLQFKLWKRSNTWVTVNSIDLTIPISGRDIQQLLMTSLRETLGFGAFVLVKPPGPRGSARGQDAPPLPPPPTPNPFNSPSQSPKKRGPKPKTKEEKEEAKRQRMVKKSEQKTITENGDCYICDQMKKEDRLIPGIHKAGCPFSKDGACLACAYEQEIGNPTNFHVCKKSQIEIPDLSFLKDLVSST